MKFSIINKWLGVFFGYGIYVIVFYLWGCEPSTPTKSDLRDGGDKIIEGGSTIKDFTLSAKEDFLGETKVDAYELNHQVDFEEVKRLAILSDDVYMSPSKISEKYLPDQLLRNKKISKTEGQYLILVDSTAKMLTISIRGTKEIADMVLDAHFIESKDSQLGIYLHSGFKILSDDIWGDMKSFLMTYQNDFVIVLTGHSLGGAVANIIGMRMKKLGYSVKSIYTFGQPKFTNKEGVSQFKDMNIIRVIDGKDPVPFFPPASVTTYSQGKYRHLGPEIILLNNNQFVYLDQEIAESNKVRSFWDNFKDISLADHKIESYIDKLETIENEPKEVHFNNRFK